MKKPTGPTKVLVFTYLAILIGFAFYLSHTPQGEAVRSANASAK